MARKTFKQKFDIEAALDELDFTYGLPLYSFKRAELESVIDRIKTIHQAMVDQGTYELPDLLDD